MKENRKPSRKQGRRGRGIYKQIIPIERKLSDHTALYCAGIYQKRGRQLAFDFVRKEKSGNGFRDPAFSKNRAQPLHRWVPWIAGFSSQFVDDCFDTFLGGRRGSSKALVLDPFAGVGTTLVEALLNGYDAIGFEINPYAALACNVKLRAAKIDLAELEAHCQDYQRFDAKGDHVIVPYAPSQFRTRIPFFSPTVEKQVFAFFDYLNRIPHREVADVFRVAFGAVMVKFSNYSYEPSLSSRPGVGKPLVQSADVNSTVLERLSEMISDIRWAKERMSSLESVGEGQIHPLNFLESGKLVPAGSVDLMVTSPPYMNNYHYVRNTRPQLFWLSLVSSPGQLKDLEEANFGKYWQTVRDRDPVGLAFDSSELVRVLADLRRTRKEKGSYGGPGWANYVASYFNDCYRFFQTLKRIMARDGIGVIVIGNSIIQGHEIKTDLVLADLAQQIGFELEGIQIIRTKRVGSSITGSTVRRGRKTAASLYESAVVIRKK